MDQLQLVAPILLYVFVVGTGLGLGILTRRFVSTPEMRGQLSRSVEGIAIQYLLPLHVATTTIREQSFVSSSFLAYIVLAVVLCLSVFVTTWLFTKLNEANALGRRYHPQAAFVASTFATGGRSIVLMSLAFPVLAPILAIPPTLTVGDMLDILVVFDLSYWLFYYTTIHKVLMPRAFVPRSATSSPTADEGTGQPIYVLGTALVLVVALAGVVNLALGNGKPYIAIPADQIAPWRQNLTMSIVILMSFSAALRIEIDKLSSGALDILFVLAARGAVIAGVFAFIAIYHLPLLPTSALLLIIVLISPPSSMVASLLTASKAPEPASQQATHINAVWNIIFVSLLGLAFVLSIVVALVRLRMQGADVWLG